jgi:hypothetical protein
MTCMHDDFSAQLRFVRFEDTGGFMLEMTISCKSCGVPMQFLGLQAGMDLQGATVSLDGVELRIAMCPQGQKPNPFQRMAFGVEKTN